mmetsp:Transcript_9678/g.29412  ORF Transcript_9678/g.29412 Transcript_9678/m.29412 type:complete len:119 (-) Transcript_9678:385-741(-)
MSWRARLSVAVNELRVIYCASSKSSAGTREFVRKYYPDLKLLNPGLPIYIRPCDGVEPSVSVRYDRGIYGNRKTGSLKADDVLDAVRKLAAASEEVNSKNASKVVFGAGSSRRIAESI